MGDQSVTDKIAGLRADAENVVSAKRAKLADLRTERLGIIAKYDKIMAEQTEELEAVDRCMALVRKDRDAALADVRRLNRALGLREDGTPRIPRGKNTGVTLEPVTPTDDNTAREE